MRANHQIVITVNSRQLGFEKNSEQIILWLHNTIPVIMQERKIVTEKIFLHAMKRLANFCLT
jgi:hypothetical protein